MEAKKRRNIDLPLPDLETGEYLPESFKFMKPSGGTFFYKILGILVLLNKYKTISYPFDFISLRNPQSFSWGGRLNTHNYKESLNQCLEDEDTKIIFICLRVGNNFSNLNHVNTLILFKNIKAIFRFESNGLNVGSYNPDELDLALEREFSYLSDWTYVKHSDIDMFDMGCQALERDEVMFKEKDDPDGFCASWNFWMIEYLIKNLDMIKSLDNLSDIYSRSCGELNPMFDPERPPVKKKIREYNVGLLKECIKYLYKFLPLFAYAQIKVLKHMDKNYASFISSDFFNQWHNSFYHNSLIEMMYQVYDILKPISDKREQSILTIHGFDLELCSQIMEEMGATTSERKKRQRIARSKKKKKPKKHTKRKKKRKKKQSKSKMR
tara:strand:- start:1323 stop:2465 length:1143 start_codon:yes stop_codon:yes gene_type:complete